MRRFVFVVGGAALLTGFLINMEAQAPAAEDPSKMEPAAVTALNEMGTYLRSLKDFQVITEGTTDIVLTDGQKVTLSRNGNLIAHFPGRLMAQMDGDQGAKTYFFDGKNFTIYSPDDGYYATVNAPPTLVEMIDTIDDQYDVQIPLADLFLWGRPGNTAPALKSAIDIGASNVDGITCEHYAYRQDGLDWQLWIQKGDHPLPKRMVLTTTTDDARPQHSVSLTWNLAPSFNDAAFTFVPPPDAHRITFANSSPTERDRKQQ